MKSSSGYSQRGLDSIESDRVKIDQQSPPILPEAVIIKQMKAIYDDIKEYPKMMFNIATWNTVSLRVLQDEVASEQILNTQEYGTQKIVMHGNHQINRIKRRNHSVNLGHYKCEIKERTKTIIHKFLQKKKPLIIEPKTIFVDSLQDPIRRKSCECQECGKISKKHIILESLIPFLPTKPAHVHVRLTELQKFKTTFLTHQLKLFKFPDRSPSVKISESTKRKLKVAVLKNQQLSNSFEIITTKPVLIRSKSLPSKDKLFKHDSNHVDMLSDSINEQKLKLYRNPSLANVRVPNQFNSTNQLNSTNLKELKVKTLHRKLDFNKPYVPPQQQTSVSNLSSVTNKWSPFKKQGSCVSIVKVHSKNSSLIQFTQLSTPYRDLQQLQTRILPKYVQDKLNKILIHPQKLPHKNITHSHSLLIKDKSIYDYYFQQKPNFVRTTQNSPTFQEKMKLPSQSLQISKCGRTFTPKSIEKIYAVVDSKPLKLNFRSKIHSLKNQDI